nr:hypothetical protein GCM10020241_24210 [Streptoalloteichus tenebrarius]
MSWHPVVAVTYGSGNCPGRPGFPPSGNSTGSATTAARSGCRNGTLTIEIWSCGGWHLGKFGRGL